MCLIKQLLASLTLVLLLYVNKVAGGREVADLYRAQEREGGGAQAWSQAEPEVSGGLGLG